MKIRWTQNSLRFRITPSELEALSCGRPVVENLALADGTWTAELRPGAAQTLLQMASPGQVRLTLAHSDVVRLSDPTAEGIYFREDGNPPVTYFVEKDFPCAHPRSAPIAEAPTETFAPPPGFAVRKNT
jgi:hypothetical protein